jgi:hypothetical protein
MRRPGAATVEPGDPRLVLPAAQGAVSGTGVEPRGAGMRRRVRRDRGLVAASGAAGPAASDRCVDRPAPGHSPCWAWPHLLVRTMRALAPGAADQAPVWDRR